MHRKDTKPNKTTNSQYEKLDLAGIHHESKLRNL
jgi:hypothetical protein